MAGAGGPGVGLAAFAVGYPAAAIGQQRGRAQAGQGAGGAASRGLERPAGGGGRLHPGQHPVTQLEAGGLGGQRGGRHAAERRGGEREAAV